MHCHKPFYVNDIGYVPCKRCPACSINKQQEWTGRMILEDRAHKKSSCFFTLTYGDGFIESTLDHQYTLVPSHLIDWKDRLRQNIGSFKYFMCGEYGDLDKGARPHYHGILFGKPKSAVLYNQILRAWSVRLSKATEQQKDLAKAKHFFTDHRGERRLAMGFVTTGQFTSARAGYCAAYISKGLINKKLRSDLNSREPEFTRMSKGLGKSKAITELTDLALSKHGQDELLKNGDISGTFTVNGKTWPIGIYLKNIIREQVGVPVKASERESFYGAPENTHPLYADWLRNYPDDISGTTQAWKNAAFLHDVKAGLSKSNWDARKRTQSRLETKGHINHKSEL